MSGQNAATMWTIKDRQGNVSQVMDTSGARPHVPDNLPTYRRLNCLHSGNPAMEVRMRAASLEESCSLMRVEDPGRDLLDRIHNTGAVDEEQAERLRNYAAAMSVETYIVDETLLLLEAAGYAANPEGREDADASLCGSADSTICRCE